MPTGLFALVIGQGSNVCLRTIELLYKTIEPESGIHPIEEACMDSIFLSRQMMPRSYISLLMID